MFDNARKKFNFQVTPSNRQLWAIGMVAVQWAAVEQWMNFIVQGLTQNDTATKETYEKTWSFSARLDIWELLADTKIIEPWRTQMLSLINETRQVQDQRDKIIHGTWGGEKNTDQVSQEAKGVFNLSKPHHPFDWKADYGTILKVALRIDRLQQSLFPFFRTTAAKDEFITSTEALRRILRTPNPGS
jgi:hypothetical protein